MSTTRSPIDEIPDLWPAPPERGASGRSPRARAPFRAGFGIALHMHQPLIPAGDRDLETAPVISNLELMLGSSRSEDAYNAQKFLECYRRLATILPGLLERGAAPRVMLDYSGCLLHGFSSMGREDVLRDLRTLVEDPGLARCAEWLGTAWGHPVAPTTSPRDFRLHVAAWRRHFADLFGRDALARVRGFSLPEMALPNGPDPAFELVGTLLDLGFEWLIVQEHTVEDEAGGAVRDPYLPQRLHTRNTAGQELSILAFVKTQGSDTKLVAQMQPWSEAQGLAPRNAGGHVVPPMVVQIADGENGGVMMNEFPPKYEQVMLQASGSDIPPLNASEYWDHVRSLGVVLEDLPVIVPRGQPRLWSRVPPGAAPAAVRAAIEALAREAPSLQFEGGSWSGERSWSRGYESVLAPMDAASARFHERLAAGALRPDTPEGRRALYHLLLSQTSCFRYWGEGLWTDYGRELCRRAML